MARENVAAATLASAAASKTTTAAPKPPVPSTVAVKTPFQLFCDDLRPSLTADNPRAGTVEIAKLLAAAWRDAPEEDKAIYSAQHQELRAEAKKAGNVPTTTAATPPAKTAGKGKGKGSRGKKRKGAPQDEDESKAAQEPEEPDSDDEDRRVRGRKGTEAATNGKNGERQRRRAEKERKFGGGRETLSTSVLRKRSERTKLRVGSAGQVDRRHPPSNKAQRPSPLAPPALNRSLRTLHPFPTASSCAFSLPRSLPPSPPPALLLLLFHRRRVTG